MERALTLFIYVLLVVLLVYVILRLADDADAFSAVLGGFRG